MVHNGSEYLVKEAMNMCISEVDCKVKLLFSIPQKWCQSECAVGKTAPTSCVGLVLGGQDECNYYA